MLETTIIPFIPQKPKDLGELDILSSLPIYIPDIPDIPAYRWCEK